MCCMLWCHFAGCTICRNGALHRRLQVCNENPPCKCHPWSLWMLPGGLTHQGRDGDLISRKWCVSKMGIAGLIDQFLPQKAQKTGTKLQRKPVWRFEGSIVVLVSWLTKVNVHSISLHSFITFQAWESLTCPSLSRQPQVCPKTSEELWRSLVAK